MTEETIARPEPVHPEINGKVTEPPKRRGRPPGSKNRSREESTLTEASPVDGVSAKRGRPRKVHFEIDQAALARQIKGTHGLVAFATGMPELMLGDDESNQLAVAFVNFAREFDFEPNPKVMAGLELAGVMGFVYIPRVIKIAGRLKKQRQQRGATVNSTAEDVSDAVSPNAGPSVN
jgi:hypothetical protein